MRIELKKNNNKTSVQDKKSFNDQAYLVKILELKINEKKLTSNFEKFKSIISEIEIMNSMQTCNSVT